MSDPSQTAAGVAANMPPEHRSQMLTIFARREPTRCATTRQLWPATTKRDVVLYRDRDAAREAGRYPWHSTQRPTKAHRTTMLNCYRWRLEWLPDLSLPEHTPVTDENKLHAELHVALADMLQPANRLPEHGSQSTENALRAALAGLLEQVEQMRGLFPDDDGAIARAIDDANDALSLPEHTP